MWFRFTQFKAALEVEEANLADLVARRLGIPPESIGGFKIERKSLDARHKELAFVYTVSFELASELAASKSLLQKEPNLSEWVPVRPGSAITKLRRLDYRPVIVGAGPAGLFAGLKLAMAGLRPIILERGDGLAERIARVEAFWQAGKLDPESNIQYGIGGAGTFSDGKLTTRVKDPRITDILATLIKLGAPEEIRYWQYPHLGTDLLREIVTKMQTLIIENGGELQFRQSLTDLSLKAGQIVAITVNHDRIIETGHLLLATGNSARDIYVLLAAKKMPVVAKPFAVGLRIEHPQDLIDRAQYGRWAGHPRLGAANYALTYQDRASGRGVYTFCMCPGGEVIGASSEAGGVVTNGMSYQARNTGVANAAVVVTVNEKDFGSAGPLAGMRWQQELERAAFQLGGANYYAPVQRVADFLAGETSGSFSKLSPSYRPGTTAANLRELFPEAISQALVNGIKYFGTQLKGFDWPDAVLTGIETRTSAPVRILRDDDRQLNGNPGIYPVGEGSGYAGGIISSALDGWKTAEAIIEQVGE